MTESAEYQPEPSAQKAHTPPILVHLGEVAQTMREMLDVCRKDGHAPEVEEVHHLRTGTRRVEATLETLAREAGARGLGKAAEEARQRWLRQLKKVRRASGNVRDLDVHRELLAENFLPKAYALASAVASAGGNSEGPALITEARALDAWLKDRRAAAVDALRSTLNDHADRLLEDEKHFMTVIAQRRSLLNRPHRPAVRLALEDYLRLMDAMPLLDHENLHDFRKGAKKARYVAESDEEDASAKAMAKAIKRVQDAIGDWHDWEVVSEEAREALGDNGKTLQAKLDANTHHAYEHALHVTATQGRRFIGEWRASQPRRARRPRATSQKSI